MSAAISFYIAFDAGYNNYKRMIGPKRVEFVESSEEESDLPQEK
jgi:hypothetical protein